MSGKRFGTDLSYFVTVVAHQIVPVYIRSGQSQIVTYILRKKVHFKETPQPT